MITGVTDAVLAVDAVFPEELQVGHFRPGARLRTAVRFSNASLFAQPDNSPDMRGAALKIWPDSRAAQPDQGKPASQDVPDFLMMVYSESARRWQGRS